jgi:hypothetical protein
MKKITIFTFCLLVLFSLSSVTSAQKKAVKRTKAVKQPTPAATATPQITSEPKQSFAAEPTPPKRNARPNGGQTNGDARNAAAITPVYFYEFERPGFTYARVMIEHDDAGKGKISFLKDNNDELISDPIELSAVTMAKLKETFEELDFLTSTENYQHEKDFSNIGNVTITLKRDGRERTARYNWTDNKLAKALMDEYRRISNEYTWRFEMAMAIENQPLQTVGLMETMDRYITQKEISDPQHILPLLEQYSTNERIPLMARNRAAKVVKQIVKASK